MTILAQTPTTVYFLSKNFTVSPTGFLMPIALTAEALRIAEPAKATGEAERGEAAPADAPRAGVRGVVAGHIAALEDGPADGLTIVGGDIDVAEHHGVLVGAFAAPIESVPIKKAGGGHIGGADIGDKVLFEEFGAQGFVMFI